jgi:hypothetical protein
LIVDMKSLRSEIDAVVGAATRHAQQRDKGRWPMSRCREKGALRQRLPLMWQRWVVDRMAGGGVSWTGRHWN